MVGPDNLVLIPTLKHWEVTAWFMRRSDKFDGLSSRVCLRGKSWAERTRVGRLALVTMGVMDP